VSGGSPSPVLVNPWAKAEMERDELVRVLSAAEPSDTRLLEIAPNRLM
jgi:hypothetical protein